VLPHSLVGHSITYDIPKVLKLRVLGQSRQIELKMSFKCCVPNCNSNYASSSSNYVGTVTLLILFHPVSNFNTLHHHFESGKTQKTAGRRLSVAIGNTKVTIAITTIQV
jgi:hypothetical protein